jgi:hypothetical protein
MTDFEKKGNILLRWLFIFTIMLIVSIMIGVTIENAINKHYVSYGKIFEYNITLEQLPTREYGKYLLEKEYNRKLKEYNNKDYKDVTD